MPLTTQPWGQTPAGPAHLYTLTNGRGNAVKLTNFGATVTSLVVGGQEWVAGYDELAGYRGEQPNFGATIGRYANRIAGGRFRLDGQTYELPTNDGGNTLHGGPDGFAGRLWEAAGTVADNPEVSFRLVSPDGDQGFPGRLTVTVRYQWTNQDTLIISYHVETDRPTVLTLTNHAYFTPQAPGDTVADVLLESPAAFYVPTDDASIPTGEILSVADTPFDFRSPTPLGRGFTAEHPQTRRDRGYDHTLVFGGPPAGKDQITTVTDPASGRRLRMATTEPGFQLFTANFAEGQFTERGGRPFRRYGAICLETQHFPDSPNQAHFPSTVLRPGAPFTSLTSYRFDRVAPLV